LNTRSDKTPQVSKYGAAKRLMNSIPGSRELLARAYMSLPRMVSRAAYRAARRTVFRDNQRRLPAFEAAFEEAAKSGAAGDYLEFGVARGTSLISAFDIARRHPQFANSRFFAFDSFCGLPGSEGDFVQGDMSYGQETFFRFIERAGVDLERVKATKGFFEAALSPWLAAELAIVPGQAHIVHIDCDLYASTVPVLNFVAPLLGVGSVIIFDDWFSFENEAQPWAHGEQRAFAEWRERARFEPLAITYPWNAAWKLTR
jgi:O-methyltransferase